MGSGTKCQRGGLTFEKKRMKIDDLVFCWLQYSFLIPCVCERKRFFVVGGGGGGRIKRGKGDCMLPFCGKVCHSFTALERRGSLDDWAPFTVVTVQCSEQ